MDKYEYNVKLEQIKKLIRKKDYATAARIADTIDWYKVKNNQTIVLIADVYEASGRYEQARENLKLAYDRSGLGRQIAYKLVKVCIKCGKIDEAEDFYDDFVSAAPRDISKYLLQYELAKAKGEPLEKQISILEQYLEEDMDDRWAFELAKLYHKTGQRDKCIEQCDTVMLWFSDGKYVDKAMDLKMIYTPLTKSQQQRYEARWREKSAQNNIKIEEIKVKEVDVANKYNTQNIQNALKESMDQIFAKEEKAKDEAAELFKPLQKKEPEEPDDYSEADGAAEDADDYIARMALNAMTYENQRKQGMAAVADDEFEEEEEKDDLGDTKIFVTTRSKKNLGDTKVFDPRKLVIPEQVSFEREEQSVKEEKKSEPEEAYIVEEKTIKREEIKEELPEEEPEIEETAETVEEPVEEEAVEEQPAEETVEEAVEETAETVEEPVEEVVEEPVEEIVEEQSVEEEHAEEEVAEKEEIPEEEPEDSTKETVVEVEPGVMEQLMEGLFSDDLFAAATTEPEVKEEPETEEAEETVEEPEIEEAEEAVEEPEIEKAEEAAEESEIEDVEEAAEEPEIEEVEEAAEEPEIEEVEDEPELEESFDGQYSFGFEEPEEDIEEEQIEGQMSLDDFFNEEGEYHVPEVDEEDDIETEPELDEEEPAVELDEVDEPEEAEVVEEEYDEADEPEVIEEEYEEPDELEVIEEEYDEPDELEIIEEEYDEADEPEVIEEEFEMIDEPDEPEIIGEEAVQDEAEEPEEVREAAVTEEEDEETEENEEIDPFETVTELKIDKNLIKHSSDFEEDSEEPDETDEDGEIEESGEEEPEDDEDEQEDQESEDDEDEKEPLSNQEIKQIIKDFIGKYSGVQGLDKQMLRTLQNVIVDDNCNIFIMGDAKSGKTSLGIDIIKVVNKIKRNNNRRIAKISADKLIGKEMAVYFDKLKGSDLFIENISLMDDDTLEDLLDAIDNDRDSRIIVIEDEKVNADKLLERHGELRDYFANRIVVKQNKIKDWVAIAQEYAEEKGYEIDEIGLLALHAKIDQLYGVTLVIQRNHVENVIDNAIKKAEKGGLFKKFFGRKKDKVLTEEHFN